MGLISLIPIFGWLQLVGWMLTALDHLRHGRQDLPPADFRYASRGIHVFLASLVWGLIVGVLLYGSMGVVMFGTLGLTSKAGTDSASAAFPALMFPLMFGLMAFFGLIFTLGFGLAPLIILFTDRT